MSEVKNNSKDKAWGPPDFPAAGRLPTDIRVVTTNYEKQAAEEDFFRQKTNCRGQKQHSKCCHNLYISLFFDGANNNEPNDTKKNHPSNIAKLFHASIQGPKAKGKGYFSYYWPGVGTLLPKRRIAPAVRLHGEDVHTGRLPHAA
jgi:hypothetical protein